MQKVTRYEDINFETNLRYDDVIRRAEEYVQEIEEPYEINKEFILYDKESYITKKPIWYVEVIHEKLKVTFPDSYEYIAISDIDGIVEYIQNDHGRIIEKKYELHVKKVRNISRCQMKLISKIGKVNSSVAKQILSNEGTCILKANETEIREAIKQLENVNIPFEIIPKFDY